MKTIDQSIAAPVPTSTGRPTVAPSGGCRAALVAMAILLVCGAGPGGAPGSAADEVTVATEPAAEPVNPDAALSPDAKFRQMDEQGAAQIEQPMFGHLATDLALLRSLHGDLPIESRRKIVKAGEQAVKEAAILASELAHANQRPKGVPVENVGDLANGVAEFVNAIIGLQKPPPDPEARSATDNDPREHLAIALKAAVAEVIGEDAVADFSAELSKREDRRRQALVRRVVGILDDELLLSAKQQETIGAVLTEKWDSSLETVLESRMNFNGRMIYPGLPYAQILPHLTAVQRDRLGDGTGHPNFGGDRRQLLRERMLQRLHMVQQSPRDPWWFE